MAEPQPNSGKILYPAVALLIALSALFGLVILPRLAPGVGGMVGAEAPDVTLPVAANGEPGARMQIAELKGQPVILDFWATWCGPCAVQAPILDRIARRYEKKGLVVLGINVDDPPQVASQYAVKKGLSYPILIDDAKEASARYGVDKLPSLVVIDRQGKVAAYLTGVVDEASLSEIIAAAL
ncbi:MULTISPECIES: TlpA family protein disulfide reductase [Sorangium]|uniref:TlpA disulfide reductase family protein n=1 Tax=Sorangium atrum TaxID=2995308 RepID=A0ABT5C0D0_9BACT|nr:TlpA disulfide reductase family protein [Sorangium aterium]MDC0679826.1 TlpA disulfide reductase family protein [Sorangium aterium]